MGTEHPREDGLHAWGPVDPGLRAHVRIRHRVRRLGFFFLLLFTALITAVETGAWSLLFSMSRQIQYIAQFVVPAQRNDKSLETGADEISGQGGCLRDIKYGGLGVGVKNVWN
jgi:hypothetical protein